jgi:hypothetical protein
MSGRNHADKDRKTRTNYSSFPRVSAGFSIVHTLAFIFAAAATAVSGSVQRRLGQRAATGVVASILFFLSILLLGTFIRFKKIQIVPQSRTGEMDEWAKQRRDTLLRLEALNATAKAAGLKSVLSNPGNDKFGRPAMLGNPSGKYRQVNILELGSLTRWTEIRRKNQLIDKNVHAHLNRDTVEMAKMELERKGNEILDDIQRSGEALGELVHRVSKRSLRSKRSRESDQHDTPTIEQSNATPSSRPGTAVEHHHSPYSSDIFTERECIMGQTVEEEAEDVASLDGGSATGSNAMIHGKEHASHAASKIYSPFDVHSQGAWIEPDSIREHAVALESPGEDHTSHMGSRLLLANIDEQRPPHDHGAHMQNKVEAADLGSENIVQEQYGYP